MRKIMLVGRSEAGKTTLTQALKGEKIGYHKTQYINYHDVVIDTPGEYVENRELARALGLYTFEADVVGLLVSAREPFCLFPPNCATSANREVIGIVTQINEPDANPELAALWLRIAGCREVFFVDSVKGEGVDKILEHLAKEVPPEKQWW